MKRFFILLLGICFSLVSVALPNAKAGGGVTVTVLYDNYLHMEGTKNDWGFSCFVKGMEKDILFDTGMNPDILFHNIEKLKVNPGDPELVVISHEHYDHTGGLWKFLDTNPNITVYFPHSFPADFTRKVEESKAQAAPVNEPVEVCKHVFLTGEMGNAIKEQSLILDTDKGLILITGCSHPGIVDIVKRAMEVGKKKVFMVFGGFHLMSKTDDELKEIVAQFKELGVSKVGATHCTGDRAIKFFKEAYSENYVGMGTGKVLTF